MTIRTIGHKRIYGTDHAVYAVVRKGWGRKWVLSIVSNGTVVMTPKTFPTKREAVAVAEAMSWEQWEGAQR